MYAHSIFKQGRSDVPIIFPMLLQSKQRNLPKILLPLKPTAKWKKIGTKKIKAIVDTVVEEEDFCMDMSVPMRRKELT